MHRDPLPGKKRYCGLAGSSDALALARLAAESRPLAVLSANALDAARLLEEIAWFAPQLRACLLPDWETLPYDSFSPHHDLVSERLATLYRIQRGDFDIVIVPAVDRAGAPVPARLPRGLHVLPAPGRAPGRATRCAGSSRSPATAPSRR